MRVGMAAQTLTARRQHLNTAGTVDLSADEYNMVTAGCGMARREGGGR